MVLNQRLCEVSTDSILCLKLVIPVIMTDDFGEICQLPYLTFVSILSVFEYLFICLIFACIKIPESL